MLTGVCNGRETARFLLLKFSGDDGVAAVNRIADHRCRLNYAIEHDSKPMPFILLGDFAELFRALAIKFELHRPAFVAVIGVRFADAIATEIGFLFDEQAFFARLFISFRRHFVNFDPILRRNNFLAAINRPQTFAVVRKNKAKLQLRHPRKLFTYLLNLRGIETGNLDQDPIVPDRTDNRFTDAENVHALPDHFDRLVEHSLVYFFIGAHQTNQKRCAALNIETELNFFFRRPDGGDAEGDEQHYQRRSQQPFSQTDVSREIPAEKNEQSETGKKCQGWTHLFVMSSEVETSLTISVIQFSKH